MVHNIVCKEFDRTYVFMDFDDEVVSMNKVWEQSEFFTFVDLLSLNITSPRLHLPTYLTIYQHFQPQYLRSSVTSLIDTSALILSKLQTSANGGMKGGWHIPTFIIWPLIILLSQVCTFNNLNTFCIDLPSMETSDFSWCWTCFQSRPYCSLPSPQQALSSVYMGFDVSWHLELFGICQRQQH